MTKRALIILPVHNAVDKSDVTGAFRPGAVQLAETLRDEGYTVVMKGFDNRQLPPKRREEVEGILWANEPSDFLAFCCHGYTTGIQTGHSLKDGMDAFVEVVSLKTTDEPVIALYACSTADTRVKVGKKKAPDGDGGFADTLRDQLGVQGFKGGHVDGHDTEGHAFKNPRVRRFYITADAVGEGGDWIVAPGSPLVRAWKRELDFTAAGALRYRFPRMTIGAIHTELGFLP